MKLVADLHIHTIASGHAFSTITEIINQAKIKDIKAVALTDHGPAMPGGAHSYHFWNLKVLPDIIDNVRVYKGIEANIINKHGELDISEIVSEELDLIIASVHNRCGLEVKGKKDNTFVLIKAIENPRVKLLAHPGNPQFPIDKEMVVKAATDRNVAIEINNSSLLTTSSRLGSKNNCLEIAKIAASLGTKVVITSDAHYAADVGNFNQAIEIVNEAGIKEENILNNNLKKVKDFLTE